MLEGTARLIAKALARQAKEGSRTTYELVAKEIGWGHPTGRGLGVHLYEVMHYCKTMSLPPLTLIVVKKGTKTPSPEAAPHISLALGAVDIEAKQKEVFAFDWSRIQEFESPSAQLP